MEIDGIIFDWGGTLSVYADVELIDMWKLAADHLATATGRDAADLHQRLSQAEMRFWDRCAATHDSGSLGELLAEESHALGLDVTEAVLEEVAGRHLDAWTPHIVHHDDTAPTLRALRDMGLRIGLLSNTHWPRSFHEHFLERDGLADLIDYRGYTSEMAKVKPDPSVFHHVLDALDIGPGRAVMVGDRPADDIAGAQGVGMKAVWRRHSLSPPLGNLQPDAVIAALSELPALISAW